MATSKAVKIEYRKGPRKGESYVVGSEAIARRVHPDAAITGYEDGSPYKAPRAPKAGTDEPTGLSALTVSELEEMAKDKDIAYSGLRKAELIAALESAETQTDTSNIEGAAE